jgi:hypothetical protein
MEGYINSDTMWQGERENIYIYIVFSTIGGFKCLLGVLEHKPSE